LDFFEENCLNQKVGACVNQRKWFHENASGGNLLGPGAKWTERRVVKGVVREHHPLLMSGRVCNHPGGLQGYRSDFDSMAKD